MSIPVYLYTGPEFGERNDAVKALKADLKKKFGDNIPMDAAVIDFQKKYKIPLAKRLLNRIKCIVLRRAMTDSNSEIPG